MSACGSLPPGWRAKDVDAFISAVDRARQVVRDAELSPPKRQTLGLLFSDAERQAADRAYERDFARGLEEAKRRSLAIVHEQPLWKVLDRNEYFKALKKRLDTCIGEDRLDDRLRVLYAVAVGGMISSGLLKSANRDARASAVATARRLVKLRERGVRLQDYGDDGRLWRLLDDLIREMAGTQRKLREDDRAGVRAAISYFTAELFDLIGASKVRAAMLVEYASLLNDFNRREIEKQVKTEKDEYLQRDRRTRRTRR